MDPNKLHRKWTELGADDPLWIILTRPDKQGGRWELGEFFQTGRDEIQQVLTELATHGTQVKKGRALDFGCGVGRLSEALAEHFAAVDGVDVSGTMIEKARQLHPPPSKVTY